MQVPLLCSLMAAVATLVTASPGKVTSQTRAALQQVNYGAFTPTATYSVANQLGFFTAYGLNVTYLQIPNSTYGYSTLLDGGYDIVTGTIDNAVNFRFNSNASLTVTGQLDQGPELTIAAIPNITDITELRGLSLIVDSPVSGFSYIIRKVLSLYGLYLEDGDYSFQVCDGIQRVRCAVNLLMLSQAVGSTVTRYADLVAGQLPDGTQVYATLLTYPFSSEAAFVGNASQPNILTSIKDFIQPLTSSAFTVRNEALNNKNDRALIRSFMAAMYSANQYLADPAHKDCSISAIAEQLNIATNVATSAYGSAIDPVSGETTSPDFTVSQQGLLNVIDVRGQFDGFAGVPDGFNFAEAIIPGKGKLIDYSVRNEALNATIAYDPVCS